MKRLTINWRLHEQMAMASIRTGTALTRTLRKQGVDISVQQINRLLLKPPERLNLQLLAALTSVLGCEIGDIVSVEIEKEVLASGTPLQKKATRASLKAVARVWLEPQAADEAFPDFL